jgi:diamine N-acetyltransferase
LLSTTTKQILDVTSLKKDEKNIFATICLKNGDQIGLLAILNVDPSSKKGEMRKMIGEIEHRGKGFAKEATEVWLDYCTNFVGLNKIYINTVETNIRNIAINRNLGFSVEGLLKKECIIDNIEHDVLRMAYFKNK